MTALSAKLSILYYKLYTCVSKQRANEALSVQSHCLKNFERIIGKMLPNQYSRQPAQNLNTTSFVV